MKTSIKTLSILTALFISTSTLSAQTPTKQDVTPDATIYQIEKRLDNYTRPITFTPTKAEAVNGAISENIMTTTQNILNKEAHFLKKGVLL